MLSLASLRGLDEALRGLVEAARELTGARYAAIGVPDGEGGFATFVHLGMTPAQLEALGELPRTHGLLGAMLAQPEPYRTEDVRTDPHFSGWPDAHPVMRSFLGVPILVGDEVVGAFYLTEKQGERHGSFDDDDLEAIRALAPHAAVAIENARLLERSRELSVVEERSRLARELHDSVTQTMLGAAVTAEAALRALERDPAAAREAVARVAELVRGAVAELRAIVFELRPAELEQDGLPAALRKHADVVARVHGVRVDVEAACDRRLDPRAEQALFRIAQEALANAVRHAGATRIEVRLALEGSLLSLLVRDDGCGFDPDSARRRGRLGLVSMRERAERLGCRLRIESAPGAGTAVALELVLPA
jgi:signal transduction histidine kinase